MAMGEEGVGKNKKVGKRQLPLSANNSGVEL